MLRRIADQAALFVLRPASARPLAVLRIGISLALNGEAAAVAPRLYDYYGPLGLVQAPIAEAIGRGSLPSLSEIADLAGIPASTAVRLVFAVYVLALHLLLIGCKTRVAAAVSWLLFLVMKKAGSASAYGAFEFAHIGLFYCLVLPTGAELSVDGLLRPASPSAGARLGLRVLQIHLCIVYLSAGIEKALGQQWWNGEAIWRGLMRPGQVSIDFSWLAEWPFFAKALCWSTVALETGYAIFVWPRRTRRWWVAAAISMHAAIAATLGLVFFSALMIVLNLAAFVVPAEAPLSRDASDAAGSPTADPAAACPTADPP